MERLLATKGLLLDVIITDRDRQNAALQQNEAKRNYALLRHLAYS